MKPRLQPVADSKAVAALGYAVETEELYVQWASGDLYVYTGVPLMVYRILLREESKGRYLNKIIKPRYPCREI
jgi:hypothetical protein